MKIDKLKSLIKLFNITIHIATNLKTTLNDTHIYIYCICKDICTVKNGIYLYVTFLNTGIIMVFWDKFRYTYNKFNHKKSYDHRLCLFACYNNLQL